MGQAGEATQPDASLQQPGPSQQHQATPAKRSGDQAASGRSGVGVLTDEVLQGQKELKQSVDEAVTELKNINRTLMALVDAVSQLKK